MAVPYVLARSKELVCDPIRCVYSGRTYAPVGRRSDVVNGVLRTRVKTSGKGIRCGDWSMLFGSGAV